MWDIRPGLDSAYKSVNLAGKINDRVLTYSAMAASAADDTRIIWERGAARSNDRPLQHKILDAACDMRLRTPAYFKSRFAASVAMTRHLPTVSVTNSLSFLPPLGGFQPLTPKFGIGELLVGRGQTVAIVVPPDCPLWLKLRAAFVIFTHFGLAGILLEAAPCLAGSYLARRNYRRAATGCLVGAVLGRAILQVPRLAVCAAAVFDGAMSALAVTTVILSIELGLRVTIGTAKLVANAVNVECRLNVNQSLRYLYGGFSHEGLSYVGLAVDDRTVDDGSPEDRTGRVVERTELMMKWFRDEYMKDTVDPEKISLLVDQSDECLRVFCSSHDTDEALRCGLSRLKAFIAWTFPDVNFDPPELRDPGF